MTASARFLTVSAVPLLVLGAAVGPVTVDGGRPGPGADGLTRGQPEEIVDAHNAWRQRAGRATLHWAADLATRAQARAAYLAAHGCVIEHGPLPWDIGENLFYVGPWQSAGRENALRVVTATYIVDGWGKESADYSAVDDRCAWGRQCGHYTQMVWPTTTEVGCGTSVCPTLGQVWVCNYRPAGNVRTIGQPSAADPARSP